MEPRTIENRPAATRGKSVYSVTSFTGESSPDLRANPLWQLSGRPVFQERRPVAYLPARPIGALTSDLRASFDKLVADYDGLPKDDYLKDGASFRYRRYGRFSISSGLGGPTLNFIPGNTYYQSSDINIYAGGIERRFAPLTEGMVSNVYLRTLILELFKMIPETDRSMHACWEAGVHPTRVLGTTSEIGYAAPEGLHQDGHVYASTVLIGRRDVLGGASIFADLDKVVFWEHVLENPGDTVIWRDAECWHDVSEIRPMNTYTPATRDIVGISFNPLHDN